MPLAGHSWNRYSSKLMNRRTFLEVSAAATVAGLTMEAATPIPVIDTHIHLFDTSRPQGVPWPEKNDTVLYHTAMPDRYRKLAVQFGIKGAPSRAR